MSRASTDRTITEYVLEGERQMSLSMAKKRLNKAFRDLRRLGLLAKQSYWCCLSCAATNIEHEAKGILDISKKRGYVLYTKQTGFVRDDGSKKVRKMVISFGSFGRDKKGIKAKAVGDLVRAVLEDCGLHVEWTGSFLHSMLVDPCPTLWNNTDLKERVKYRVKTRFERIGVSRCP